MKVAVDWTIGLVARAHSWPCLSVSKAIMPVHRKLSSSSVRLHGRTLPNYYYYFFGGGGGGSIT